MPVGGPHASRDRKTGFSQDFFADCGGTSGGANRVAIDGGGDVEATIFHAREAHIPRARYRHEDHAGRVVRREVGEERLDADAGRGRLLTAESVNAREAAATETRSGHDDAGLDRDAVSARVERDAASMGRDIIDLGSCLGKEGTPRGDRSLDKRRIHGESRHSHAARQRKWQLPPARGQAELVQRDRTERVNPRQRADRPQDGERTLVETPAADFRARERLARDKQHARPPVRKTLGGGSARGPGADDEHVPRCAGSIVNCDRGSHGSAGARERGGGVRIDGRSSHSGRRV